MFCWAVKTCLLLFAFFSLVFSSCTTVARHYDYPDEIGYKRSSGQIYTSVNLMMEERYSLLGKYFQSVFPYRYEKYLIEMSLGDLSYLGGDYNNDGDTVLYMYIDECRIVLPSGSIIDLLDNNIDITYTYTGYTGQNYFQKVPPKTLRNIQLQHTEDSKKTLYLDGIVDRDDIRIRFHAKIPSSVNFLHLEYTLAIVWENRGEVKTCQNLLFKKKSDIYNLFITV